MLIRIIYHLFANLLLLSFFIELTLAATSDAMFAGQTIYVRGKAGIIFAGETLQGDLSKGQELYPNDTVITRQYSRVGILLVNNSRLKINENSKCIIKRVDPVECEMELISGEIWSNIMSTEDTPESFKIKTPSAHLAIRGTDWFTRVNADGKTFVIVNAGYVELYNEFGAIRIRANEMGMAEKGKPPIRVVAPKEGTQWIYFMRETLRYIYFYTHDASVLNQRLRRVEEGLSQNPLLGLMLEKAEILHDLGNLTQSMALFLETEKIKTDRRVLTGMALGYLKRGEWVKSRKIINTIALEETSPVLELVRFSILVHENRFAEAFNLLNRARKDYSENEFIQAGFANLLLLRGEYGKTESFCKDMLKKFPNSPAIATFLKDAYIFLDKTRANNILTTEILKENPHSALAYFDRAFYLHKVEGKESEALKKYDQAISFAPENPCITTHRGDLMRQMGDYARSRRLFQAAIAKGFKNSWLLYHYALLLSQIHENQKALSIFEQARANQGEIASLSGEGVSLLKKGRPKEALKLLLQATMTEPLIAENHIYLAIAYYQLGEVKAALEVLDKASEADPNDSTPYIIKSIIYNDDNEPYKAIQETRKAEKLLPYRKKGVLDILNATKAGMSNIAYSLKELGLDMWSVRKATQILTIDPYDPNAHLFPSVALSSLGQYMAGQSEFIQGVMMDPSAIVSPNRYQTIIKVPGHYTSLRFIPGYEAERISDTTSLILNGYVDEPVRLNYSIHAERGENLYYPRNNPDILSLKETGRKDYYGIVTMLGWQPAYHSDFYSRLIYKRDDIDSALYDDKSTPFQYLLYADKNSEENTYTLFEGGYHCRISPTSHLLIRPHYMKFQSDSNWTGIIDPFELYPLFSQYRWLLPSAFSGESFTRLDEIGVQLKHFFTAGDNHEISYGMEYFHRKLKYKHVTNLDNLIELINQLTDYDIEISNRIGQEAWKFYARDRWKIKGLLLDFGTSLQYNWVDQLREETSFKWAPRLGVAVNATSRDTFRIGFQKNVIPLEIPITERFQERVMEYNIAATRVGTGQLESIDVAGIYPYEFFSFMGLDTAMQDVHFRWEREWSDHFYHFVDIAWVDVKNVADLKIFFAGLNWIINPRMGGQFHYMKASDIEYDNQDNAPPFVLDLFSDQCFQFKLTYVDPRNFKICAWYDYSFEKESHFEKIGNLDSYQRVTLNFTWENKTKEYGVNFFWLNAFNNDRDKLPDLPFRDSYLFLNFEWRF